MACLTTSWENSQGYLNLKFRQMSKKIIKFDFLSIYSGFNGKNLFAYNFFHFNWKNCFYFPLKWEIDLLI